jgi:NAD(P)-dependent dehydrogenase (short-subunit alcohol dehydrogenase family)
MMAAMGSLTGKQVVVTGGRGALGRAVLVVLSDAGGTVHVPDVDLSIEEDVVAFYRALPGLWASIHLAGGYAGGALADTSLADFRAMHDKNAVTCFLCCREAVKVMRRSAAGGRIVNVAARPALVPARETSAYAASKAAVASLTQSLGAELVGEGILVNAVVPSMMDTPANRQAMPDADFSRWPTTQEVARAIAFLASPENTLTSGALVPVYGRA